MIHFILCIFYHSKNILFPIENNFQCVFSFCVFRVIFSFPYNKIFYQPICFVDLLVFLLSPILAGFIQGQFSQKSGSMQKSEYLYSKNKKIICLFLSDFPIFLVKWILCKRPCHLWEENLIYPVFYKITCGTSQNESQSSGPGSQNQ